MGHSLGPWAGRPVWGVRRSGPVFTPWYAGCRAGARRARSASGAETSGAEASGAGADGPGGGHDVEGRLGQQLATVLAQPDASDLVEALHVCARRADAERVGVPPVVEGRVPDRHREGGVLDLVEPGPVDEVRQFALPDPAHPRLVVDAGVEVA